MRATILLFALAACNPTPTISPECEVGVDQVDGAIAFGALEYGDWINAIASRLHVTCVNRQEVGDWDFCRVPEVNGCTIRLGNPLGALGEPTSTAEVISVTEVNVANLLCHEIVAHWREDGLCDTHGPECFGDDRRADEKSCKEQLTP